MRCLRMGACWWLLALMRPRYSPRMIESPLIGDLQTHWGIPGTRMHRFGFEFIIIGNSLRCQTIHHQSICR